MIATLMHRWVQMVLYCEGDHITYTCNLNTDLCDTQDARVRHSCNPKHLARRRNNSEVREGWILWHSVPVQDVYWPRPEGPKLSETKNCG